ncbi:class II fructose-bisphosphate aldolase [Selenomonas noxia]|uniref:class II fructose-bisphosphate aldolase n=1 Tax=Selenomonas noxia TaxID=135083 RepID=UPI0028EBC773|nr:class II fructose-bisphosphate aldolase [Selenomonas noxia]
MLVDGKSVLDAAKAGRYGIVAPDFLTLNAARVFVQTADALKTPILLSFAQGHAGLISLEEAALVGKYWAEKVATPIVLHLDHGQDFDFLRRAIELGFTSVMLDASMKEMDENIRLTKEVVAYAHTKGVSVEAEIGHVGGASEGVEGATSESVYTTVEEAKTFAEATAVDSLAVSIGTSHGVYKSNKAPELNFPRLRELAAGVPVPLVLHGGSGTGDENLRRAVREGIAKLNIYTDFLTGAMAEIKAAHTDSLIETQKAADEGMRRVLTHYINLISKI